MQLTAARDLTVRLDERGRVRLGISGSDWFGPGAVRGGAIDVGPSSVGSPEEVLDDLGIATQLVVADGPVRCSVRAYRDRPLVVFKAEATADLEGLATGSFDVPAVAWPWFVPGAREAGQTPDGLRALAYQHCEFALPAVTDELLDGFFLLPHRPPTGWPLIVQGADGPALVMAPLDAFHEQTIGLNGGTVRVGWHGDLEGVPAGFATEVGCFLADDARAGLDTWAAVLRTRAATVRPGRWADALATRPSYWTDNGAAYWYRTEPGHDAAGSIVAAVDELRASGVQLGAVQLDSWFYPHVELRPFDTEEWLVPPTAMVAWEPREDVLPDGIGPLRGALGDPPLVAHIRHLSSTASIADDVPVYVDGPYAVSSTSEGYERWLDQCVTWGVETFEHDWLVEVFFGVRPLRARPGRARAWQEGIDSAARERGVTLQWCMGTPADFAQTTTLTQVTSVRTCGDHGYIATAGQLWAWFCVTNALARSLGLAPFKDVFRTDPDVAGANGEPEALLSALSTGPVGLGDRAGRCDTTLVAATCRDDGVLIKPHVPIAATSASMLANAAFTPALLVASSHSLQPAGRWSYVVAMHTYPSDEPVRGEVSFAELGSDAPEGPVMVWDWRARAVTRADAGSTIGVELPREGWWYGVAAPVLPAGLAVFGDVAKFVPAGDARVEISATASGARLVVKGAGETVTITGWAAAAPESSDGPLRFDRSTGVWELDVTVGARGWHVVEVRAAT